MIYLCQDTGLIYFWQKSSLQQVAYRSMWEIVLFFFFMTDFRKKYWKILANQNISVNWHLRRDANLLRSQEVQQKNTDWKIQLVISMYLCIKHIIYLSKTELSEAYTPTISILKTDNLLGLLFWGQRAWWQMWRTAHCPPNSSFPS